jgi:hypothetical protein
MRRLAGLLCGCLLAAGCAAGSYEAASKSAAVSSGGAAAEAPAADRSEAGEGVKPRIIYTAEAHVVAEDFAAAGERLDKLVSETGGYVASASEDRRSGAFRSGQWTVRIPVGKFEAFLASLDSIGFVESRSRTSEDVTMVYVDVEARIANLRRLEERYVTLLKEQTGKLEDVLKVEQELARVRGEIEQAEGRLRYLTNKTDFATVTVSLREEKDYVPPKAPTLGERVATTWSESLSTLRRAGELALLAAVAVAPWAIVAMVPVLAVAATVRLALRRKARLGGSQP